MKLPNKLSNLFKYLSVACLSSFALVQAQDSNPNIIYILADDMGYGDVQVYAPKTSKILTPHMDRLAHEGMMFTDMHTNSSVCTPTRYGVLTGRYSWRTHLQDGVLRGYSKTLIADDRLTVPGLLQENGYKTAIIGKWHLGMMMPTTDGKPAPVNRRPKTLNINWNGEIKEGPADRGFDYFYGISASLDMAPYIYIENRKFIGEIPQDGKSATVKGFVKSEVLPEIGRKTVEYIGQQDGSKPYFIYVPLTSPHTPIVPSKEWLGKSGLGKYADFQMQTDHVIGEIIKAVDASGQADNTIIIVTSDNGCSKAANIKGLEKQGHYPSAHLRGSKSDLWDGGHRVPFIVRWPAKVKAGTTSDALICITDLMATCADIVGATLPDNAGEDSVSFLPALHQEPIETERVGIIHHSISGHFAYRINNEQGNWKLMLAKGSGGWTSPTEKKMPEDSSKVQLYNMDKDQGEQHNLALEYPDKVEQLLSYLKSDVNRGRSTPGADQANDVTEINLWKGNVAK